MAAKLLSTTFKSVKPHNNINNINNINVKQITKESSPSSSSSSSSSSWSVYLILSTNKPIKTYVGVTNNFNRRLKQHNGELQGGAKSSRAGRPWICACLIKGFADKSQACVFESRWKSLSKKLNRKRKIGESLEDVDVSLPLLQHRHTALERVKESTNCSHLNIDWHLDPS